LYKRSMEEYKQFTGKDLSQLKIEAEKEEETIPKVINRKISDYIIGYKSYLENKDYAPGTINNRLSSIFSFYQAFDIQIPSIKLKQGDICLDKNYCKLLTKEEINKMLNVANARDTALIYLLALSGMGQREARDLTVRKFLEIASEVTGVEIDTVDKLFEHEKIVLDEVLTLTIVRGKSNYRYQTFVPAEVSGALITYLKERYFNRNEKLHITNIDAPIFLTKQGNPMTETGVGNELRRVGKLAGFKSTSGAYCYWRPHALRKYFYTTVLNNSRDVNFADYLIGHKIPDVRRAYWLSDAAELKGKYIEVLPYLSIDEIRDNNPKTKELEKRLQHIEDFQIGLYETVENAVTEDGSGSSTISLTEALKAVIDIQKESENHL
ncbi:MAG: tyrosine-type recombinase/integrase, partial [Methanobacterium paludis]|nr:tyrosine-type recombinase/integrase [Methanobacterium paludis]